jgi:hypothetical protein
MDAAPVDRAALGVDPRADQVFLPFDVAVELIEVGEDLLRL